jgi:hypothetical protein
MLKSTKHSADALHSWSNRHSIDAINTVLETQEIVFPRINDTLCNFDYYNYS